MREIQISQIFIVSMTISYIFFTLGKKKKETRQLIALFNDIIAHKLRAIKGISLCSSMRRSPVPIVVMLLSGRTPMGKRLE